MNGKRNIMNNRLVFIFKAPKENLENDKYEEILSFNRIPYAVIPVLSFGFVNRDALVSHLLQPDTLSAIILTSTRAVEAIVCALQDLNNGMRELVTALQCFVVGPATYDAAVAAGFKPEGKDSGNGRALAEHISDKVKDTSKPLFFPCSSIRKESIPDILTSRGLKIKEVVAYETYPDEHIGDYVKEAIAAKGFPEYTVFFSPSGFKYTLAAANASSFALEQTKIIALGPSTAAAVTEQGYNLHGTTERPNPESLFSLLKECMSMKSGGACFDLSVTERKSS